MIDKKVSFLIALFFLIFLFIGANQSLAQHDSGVGWQRLYGGDLERFEEDVFGTEQFNQPSHAYSNLENIALTGTSMIIGCMTDDCRQVQGSASGGTIGFFASQIESVYLNRPASSALYFADLGQRFGFIQPAYAQGVGFTGLSVLLPLWRQSRNVAYIFFVIVFVLTGFAIMFRAKISPQAVITIQSAIPRVIVALILVTFSYAIVGLVIDFMYLLIAVVVNIFQASGVVRMGPDAFSEFVGMNFGRFLGEIFHIGTQPVGGPGWATFIQVIITTLSTVLLGPLAGGISTLPILIFSLIFLFAVFGTFFSLLLAYVRIIISLLVGPLQLMISVLPGQNTFSSWLKGLLSNALAFPAVITMLLIAKTLTQNTTRGVWAPPIISSDAEAGGIIGGALALGVLLMTPKVVDIVKSLFEGQAFQYGSALKGGIIGPPAAVMGTGETIAKSSSGGLLSVINRSPLLQKQGFVQKSLKDRRARIEAAKTRQAEDASQSISGGLPDTVVEAGKRGEE